MKRLTSSCSSNSFPARLCALLLKAGLLALLFNLACPAQATPPPVSYSRQILPLFKTQCLGCHSGATPPSGYSMETRDKLIAGGRRGAALTVGKGAESNLVRYMTGELKPKMPPNGAIDLEKIALVRRWIDEGAKVDSERMLEGVRGGEGERRRRGEEGTRAGTKIGNAAAPVTTLAYSPDGKTLAVGGFRVVRLVDSATGEVRQTIGGCADQVQCVAWSSDGKCLAASGGIPAQAGEVVIFDTSTWKPLRSLVGHAEVVYAVAWKPNSMELVTGSLDKTACIWDGMTGRQTHIIKDHAEGVLGVAYSPDGKLLATGSLDRSAKLFDTTNWKRVAALTAHQDGVTRVAFNHNGSLLATVGLDRTLRVWTIKKDGMENPDRTQNEGDSINACAFSPDGSLLVYGASNNRVKMFNQDGSKQTHDLREPQDWVYSVAVSADNQTVAGGTQDGKILFWDAKMGKLLREVALLPKTATTTQAKEGARTK